MKKIITGALILALSIGAANAQTKDEQDSLGHRHGRHMMAFKKLNLSDVQKAQIKSLREDMKKQMTDLKAQNLSEADRKSHRQELHKQFREKLESILTPVQKDQLAKMRADWKAKHGDQNGSFAWGHKGGKNFREAAFQKELGLTSEQEQKMKDLRTDFHSRMEDIRKDQSLTQDQKKDKIKELAKERREQMKTILTPEQLQKLQSLRKDHLSKETK